MAKKNVAVYDCSSTYINRFLKYVNGQKPEGISVTGFTEIPALKKYLEHNRCDLLLFSMEEQMTQAQDAEELCSSFLDHPSVREFVYLGERRNSKSRVKHIDKYQPAGKILTQLKEILFPEQEKEAPKQTDSQKRRAELITVFSPASEEATALCALEIAELVSVRKEVIFLDLERFPLVPGASEKENACSISDLIYFYKTNPKKLTECLREKKRRFHNMDVLCAPEDMEDMDEIPEKEWPAFLQQLAFCGGYETVVVHAAEAFRNPDYLLDASDQIFAVTGRSERARRKMRKAAAGYRDKGRKDLYDRMQAVLPPEERKQTEERTERQEWNW